MKIHEYQASELFREFGVPIGEGKVTTGPEEALAFAREAGFPVVLKAQVLAGGRGKAGGVKLAADENELAEHYSSIRNLKIKGYPVEKILIVRAIDIRKEFYAAVTVDNARNDVVAILSPAGGVDIEETARTDPDTIFKFYLQGQKEPDATRWDPFIRQVFRSEESVEQVGAILRKLLQLFFAKDCSLAEINPLVVDTQGRWIAADAKVNLDENALFRHPEISETRDMAYENADEMEAKENNLSFVKMEGNVGCIVNGAGLAMATMDVVKLMGGEPANFLDVGGSSSPEKVLNALKIILRNRDVRSILINIFGGITRCDDIAKGILQAKGEIDMPVPLVVRLTGTNEEEAKDLLAKAGISTYASMREAVAQAVKLAK